MTGRLVPRRSTPLADPLQYTALQSLPAAAVLVDTSLRLHQHHHHHVSVRLKQAKLFLSQLRQISIKFNNFWQKDDKDGAGLKLDTPI